MPKSGKKTLRKPQRITATTQFREAYLQNKKTVGQYMVMYIREADNAQKRLGVVTSKKVGNAVCRNRARRRLREVFRLNRHRLNTTADIVLVARKSIENATWQALQNDFTDVITRARLNT